VTLLREVTAMFAVAFREPETYLDAPPTDEYLRSLLSRHHFITLAAIHDDVVVGALVAYVLDKFEQKRSEVYIYDLAVAEEHRRKGIATGIIEALKPVARERGAWVIFVQADACDEPATALYESLGRREEVLHFDIEL
jgi:aminoglycoside 3-N-acetyltransferase I